MTHTLIHKLVKPFKLAALLISCCPIHANGATSVSQHGITWTFSADRPVGQFANGDWWVVGPVTIVHISPNDPTPWDSAQIHGTMVNPQYNTTGRPNWNGNQAWDSRIRDSNYVTSLNIARSLPYTITSASSIVSCKSLVEQALGNNPQMDTIAILTVLNNQPAPGSFRPPYIGTNKTIKWNKSNINYSRLRSLPVVTGTPAFSTVESYFERAHIALGPSWSGTYLHPRSNDSPGYGREISHKVGAGALLLNLNYSAAQKERLVVRMIQRGIDIYGIQASGGGWWPDGGHNHGRKFPMILAGWLLNDADILSKSNGSFAEDGQHFFVSQADVDRARKIGREPYTTKMIGTPEWGGNHIGQPEGDGSQWNVPYRTLVGVSNMGPVLAARIMGMQTVWNHPATFAYMDRFYSVESGNVSTGTNSIQPFVSSMWKSYRNNTTNTSPITIFKIGDRIQLSANTNVRTTGSLSGTLIGTQPASAEGTIIAGPVSADNITWWQINYDSGSDGWSGSNHFTLSSSPKPIETNPTPLSFKLGERIQLNAITNVRISGGLSAQLLGTQAIGNSGVIVSGPVYSDNITWWKMDYDIGIDGWSGQNNFSPAVSPFGISTRIELVKIANVRSSPSLSGALIATLPVATTGTILSGPIHSDSIIWWQIKYDNGTIGWSGEDNLKPVLFTLNDTVLKIGSRIQLSSITNVRSSGSLNGLLLGTQPANSFGTILEGPIQSEGISWWRIDYDTGVDGWSGSNNLIVSSTISSASTLKTSESSATYDTPQSPTGLKIISE
jgi:hypothetical protein